MTTHHATAAAELAASYTRGTRSDGTIYTKHKDDAPEWCRDATQAAHGGALPDDWKYAAAEIMADSLADTLENDPDADRYDATHAAADAQVDVYTADLTAWIASSVHRVAYVTEAAEEYGLAEDTERQLMMGQYAELMEIGAALLEAIEQRADELEPDELAELIGGEWIENLTETALRVTDPRKDTP